jgi:endonuclease-3
MMNDAAAAALVKIFGDEVPRKDWTKFCHRLPFHGRRICTARSPDCPACSINKPGPKIGVI